MVLGKCYIRAGIFSTVRLVYILNCITTINNFYRLTLTLSCPMKLNAYPLDVQTCFIDFASYAYTSKEILYRWKADDPIQIKHGLHQSLPSFTLSQVYVGNCSSVTSTGKKHFNFFENLTVIRLKDF